MLHGADMKELFSLIILDEKQATITYHLRWGWHEKVLFDENAPLKKSSFKSIY